MTVAAMGCVPPDPSNGDPLLPHPSIRKRPAAVTTSTRSIGRRRLFFQTKQQSPTASAVPGNIGLDPYWRMALVAEVVTVSVGEVLPGGVAVCGEKLHVAPDGNPEQLNETAELNPFAGVIEMMAVTLCPAATVNEPGEALTEKSGAGWPIALPD